MPNDDTFAIRLLRAKSRECMTAAELARESGLHLSAVNDFAAGRKTNPTMKSLLGLAKALNVSVDYLCGLKDKP